MPRKNPPSTKLTFEQKAERGRTIMAIALEDIAKRLGRIQGAALEDKLDQRDEWEKSRYTCVLISLKAAAMNTESAIQYLGSKRPPGMPTGRRK